MIDAATEQRLRALAIRAMPTMSYVILSPAETLALLDTIAELRRENERVERLGRGLQTATAEIQAENAELRRDAERYRWLRLADDVGPRTMQMQYHHVEHLDAAIDRALTKQQDTDPTPNDDSKGLA